MRRTLPLLSLASVLAAACAPDGGPVDMAVLAPDPDTGAYRLEVVRIETLEDVTTLRGAAATPIGGATLDFDPRRLAGVENEADFRARLLTDAGGPVEAQFVEEDGVLWPVDFHTLNLATAYRNFEVIRRYAIARGLDPAGPLTGVPFYYFPRFLVHPEPGRTAAVADNAAYFAPLHAFLLLPFAGLQDIPLPMNLGAVAHEYGHAIFGAVVYGPDFLPAYALRWDAGSSGVRLLGSLEEGFGDAWALGASRDPRFASHSLPGAVGTERDVSTFDPARHCYSPVAFAADLLASRSCADGGDTYWAARQYRVGTVFAAALWRAGAEPGTDYDRVMDAVYASYRAAGPASLAAAIDADPTGAAFGDLAVPARALIAGAPDEPTRTALCRVLAERLALAPDGCGGIPPATDGCQGITLAREACP